MRVSKIFERDLRGIRRLPSRAVVANAVVALLVPGVCRGSVSNWYACGPSKQRVSPQLPELTADGLRLQVLVDIELGHAGRPPAIQHTPQIKVRALLSTACTTRTPHSLPASHKRTVHSDIVATAKQKAIAHDTVGAVVATPKCPSYPCLPCLAEKGSVVEMSTYFSTYDSIH